MTTMYRAMAFEVDQSQPCKFIDIQIGDVVYGPTGKGLVVLKDHNDHTVGLSDELGGPMTAKYETQVLYWVPKEA